MLTIVVPVLNEAARIEATLEGLQPLRARGAELIVVDGDSDDDTAALAAPLADYVVGSRRGRARQMNAGTERANGATLLFLHADTTLPADADQHIAGALRRGARWGRFDVQIIGRHPLLPLVAWLMNQRSRLTGIATGDQAIFVDRATFVAAGGFPDQALMEDIALSTKLRRHSRPACLPGPAQTSGRRWDEHGFWRTIGLMWRLRLAYWRGADPAALARRYGYATDDTASPGPLARRVRRSSGRRVALLVFAKAPVPGAVKTRLIPAIGADAAAALAVRLLERTLTTAAAGRFASLQLWCTPDARHPALVVAATRHGASMHVQNGADLGERMQTALAEALTDHHAALLIGTDCPELSVDDLRNAAQQLAGPRDVALVPAADGGYVLIGLTRPSAAVFAGVDWGSPRVMDQTRARAAAAGLRLHFGRTLRDIDHPEDLPLAEFS
ncbi:MAG TPA: TIGR04283 family arsenosugar biosynthesis glycosyltransferase [Rhodocyclaceae bacterium]